MADQFPLYAYPSDPVQLAVVMATRPQNLIADEVLPRTSPLSKMTFKYGLYPLAQFYNLPESRVGRKSRINEVDFTAEQASGSTEDYGLEYPVPFQDENDCQNGSQLVANASAWMTEMIHLQREVNVAKLLMNPATYGANGNLLNVSGGDLWTSNTAEPYDQIEELLEFSMIKPTHLVFGHEEWKVFKKHPNVLKRLGRNGINNFAAATESEVGSSLGVRILVGESRHAIGNVNQPLVTKRAWAGGVSALYVNKIAASSAGSLRENLTFGFTAQYQNWVAANFPDKNLGLRGGSRVRVGESRAEIICAPSLGALIVNPLNLPL